MISIIVPIYNVEKYIRQCVDSILNQTYRDIEIILVDDGSPDNCAEICDNYAKKDGRVKIVHKKNGGLMSARQAGLRAATGEYVGFVDGDDWIEPDMYGHFADVIKKYKPDMALCEFIFAYPNQDVLSSQKLSKEYFSKEEITGELYPTLLFKTPYYNFGINPCCWSKVFRREILENNLYRVTPKIKIGEDAAFTYPCILECQNIAYVDEYLYHYRSNPDSMTNSYDDKLEDTILIPYEILKASFTDCGYDFSSQMNYYLVYLINMVIRNEANPENKKAAGEKIKTFKHFTENADVVNAAKNLDYSKIPLHTKFVAKFLSMKSPLMLYLYSLLLKKFL